MQTECPRPKFYRLDPIRDELWPQAAERFDKLALFNRLRREGATEATALMAAGCSRATLYRWKRRLREQGVRALANRCRRRARAGALGAAAQVRPPRQALALRRPRAKARPDGPDRPPERRHRGRLLSQGIRGRMPGYRSCATCAPTRTPRPPAL